ncbi:hypothetical protein RHSIM_RhsimUnG0072100 [Rhododendron simsii]|uniref:Senescence-associated protein n=1 Tax=Rhododendron simsii TaxID=118357 RepID=A0A834L5B3_RHOSS|nr:hypothetical protein RHSIM_RhsimUnG0072100 [Rhododendron simsii]
MIGRADIEGSKSNVAMNAWLPQASYPCGNFSGTSSLKFRGTKGSIGHTFMVCIHTENQNQGDFYPFVLLEISVLHESPLGHLRYGLTDVPPQPNSPPDNVFNPDQPVKDLKAKRGCSPWRPAAVMSTTWRERHSVLRIFKAAGGAPDTTRRAVLFQPLDPTSG